MELLYAEVSVSVALPNVEMVLVDQLAVTPVGNPLTVSITVPVNP